MLKTTIFALNFSGDQISNFLNYSKAMEMKVGEGSLCTDVAELQKSSATENIPVGVVISLAKNKEADFNAIKEICLAKKLPLIFVTKEAAKSDNTLIHYIQVPDFSESHILDPLLFNLVPLGFKSVCLNAAKFIGESVLPGMDMTFRESNKIKSDENLLINCELVDKSILSTISIKVSLTSFKSRDELYKDIDNEVLVDSFKEYANQLMGSINFNLAKIEGLSPRGSLPVSILNDKGGARRTDLFFKPGFYASNGNGDIQIKFDFLNLKGVDLKQLNSADIEFAKPEETAEFF